MSLVGIRRSKTVCDVRPELTSAERNGRTKKRNIFSKMLRSLSKLSKRKSGGSSSVIGGSVSNIIGKAGSESSGHLAMGGDVGGSSDSVLNDKNVNDVNCFNSDVLPGTSFGDSSGHAHGSDSASTGYVSEGSSRRMTNSLNNVATKTQAPNIDLERENKLAKRAHAARFRSDTDFIRNRSHRRARHHHSDTDLDRDETDLETDEDRDSEIHTEDSDEPSDSFYTSDCSSSVYATEDDSRGESGAGVVKSSVVKSAHTTINNANNGRVDAFVSRRQHVNNFRNESTRVGARATRTTTNRPLPAISRTMSARVFGTEFNGNGGSLGEALLPAPSAPSPALRARIMRLKLGEQIDTSSSHGNTSSEGGNKSDENSGGVSPAPVARGNAVKEIASRFLQEQQSRDTDIMPPLLSKPIDLKRTQSTSVSNNKSRPVVLEKFAPKLECDNEKNETDLSKPIGIRRTQSTKILDLANNVFQPGAEIDTSDTKTGGSGVGGAHGPPPTLGSRKLPMRSQTCKMTSPKSAQRRQSSDSFIRELLEMAKVEVNLGDDKTKKANDFKSQISQASTKIARRKTFKEDDIDESLSLRPTKSTMNDSDINGSSSKKADEKLDPFVKEILDSDTVPKAVKNKIKEECWSLFNDPRTPKGVKQCILNTMLTKTHSE